MNMIIDWLASLETWQAMLVSGMVTLVGVLIVTLICAIVFKRMDSEPITPITEEELKRRRAHAGFVTATKPKLRGLQ